MPEPKPGQKFRWGREAVTSAKEAGKSVMLDQIKDWEQLNISITKLAQEKKTGNLHEKIKDQWTEFTVHGSFMYDPKEDKRVFKPLTDLDGKCALGILNLAGVNTDSLEYVPPGQFKEGAVNIDTGDRFGAVYDEEAETLFFDHHEPGHEEITSATEAIYKTMVGLRMVEKTEAMDRLIEYVNGIDNRLFPPAEFLKSGKTILGLQRALDFNKLQTYFQDHDSPTEELTPEEFEKYGLKDVAEQQQKVVDEAMKKLGEMEKDGKIIDTKYGQVVVNANNELRVGASAAYVKYDGIINYTPDKSFAVTFKDKNIDEEELKEKLGDRFQGKMIRGKMWIFNEKEPLKISVEEIIEALQ